MKKVVDEIVNEAGRIAVRVAHSDSVKPEETAYRMGGTIYRFLQIVTNNCLGKMAHKTLGLASVHQPIETDEKVLSQFSKSKFKTEFYSLEFSTGLKVCGQAIGICALGGARVPVELVLDLPNMVKIDSPTANFTLKSVKTAYRQLKQQQPDGTGFELSHTASLCMNDETLIPLEAAVATMTSFLEMLEKECRAKVQECIEKGWLNLSPDLEEIMLQKLLVFELTPKFFEGMTNTKKHAGV